MQTRVLLNQQAMSEAESKSEITPFSPAHLEQRYRASIAKLEELRKNESQNTKNSRLGLWIATRSTLASVGISKSLFYEELSWLSLMMECDGIWIYSKGKAEALEEAVLKQLFADNLTAPASVLSDSLTNVFNDACRSSNGYSKDAISCFCDALRRCVVTGIETISVSPLFSLKCNDVRNVTTMSVSVGAFLGAIQSISADSKSIEGSKLSVLPSGLLYYPEPNDAAEDSDRGLSHHYNRWIQSPSVLEQSNVRLEVSANGKNASCTPLFAGYLARRILYFIHKYGSAAVLNVCPLNSTQLLEYVAMPITTRELMEEISYFAIQGDINPWVFIGSKERKQLAVTILAPITCKPELIGPLKLKQAKATKEIPTSANSRWKVKAYSYVTLCRFVLQRGTETRTFTEGLGVEIPEDIQKAIQQYRKLSLSLRPSS